MCILLALVPSISCASLVAVVAAVPSDNNDEIVHEKHSVRKDGVVAGGDVGVVDNNDQHTR